MTERMIPFHPEGLRRIADLLEETINATEDVDYGFRAGWLAAAKAVRGIAEEADRA